MAMAPHHADERNPRSAWRKDADKELRRPRALLQLKRVEEELRSSREQLRRLSARVDSTIERERTELARELHDQLGQSLTALKMDLAWIAAQVEEASGDPIAIGKKIAAMMQAIDTTIRRVRRISADLRPIALDRLGLLDAIAWLADDFERRTGVRCRLESRIETLDLAPDRATQVFRIVQEALVNTTRHANATRVTIAARLCGGICHIDVRDNGRGISHEEAADPRSLGLLGMRERALLVGGDVTISRAGRKGTIVAITIPTRAARSIGSTGSRGHPRRRTGASR